MVFDRAVIEDLAQENAELRARLEEAEETLRAIREGEVDALIIDTSIGQQLFTLQGADQSYRTLVESMQQGAATLLEDGTVCYCNGRLAEMLERPIEQVMGANIKDSSDTNLTWSFFAIGVES